MGNEVSEKLCGIIPVNKPEGWTSFDVIGKLRGVLHIKRLGHSGTLDPMATGVLPVFVGKATKACDEIPDRKKAYLAGFRLGLTSDTEDITGNVLTTSDKAVTDFELKKAAEEFQGDIMQIPPMYSAVKVGGKKLYELAREGKTIERKPRQIHIDSIEIIGYDENTREGKMYIRCEKGTYVRTVIADIGKSLGVGGVMTTLERTYSGGIGIEQCLTVEEIVRTADSGEIERIIIPVDVPFEEYREVRLSERITGLYRNGVKLRPTQVGFDTPNDERYRVYGSGGEFLGIGAFKNGEFRSVKNFF
jgi:tRNA pseudouridine55 synthase